jgi:hypothetical protein
MTLAAQTHRLVPAVPSADVHLSQVRRPIGHLTVSVLSDDSAFERLRFEWDELLDDSAQCVFFLRRRWNQLWWRYYAPRHSRLHLMTCRDDDGRLIGLAPFYWREHRVMGVPYTRELLFLGMGIDLKTSEYLDVIARRGAERNVAETIGQWLRTHKTWDRLWLWQVPSESLVLPHLARVLGGTCRTDVCDRAPYIDTSTDWESFKAGFGRSMRRNVEYYSRRLFKTYPSCRFERIRHTEDLEAAMDALVNLHQARWQAQGEPGAFSGGFDVFLREIMRHAFRTSRLALWTLTIEGRIEAALVGFQDNGVLHYFQKGFNPAFAKEDLGTAMLALCVRDCFDDPEIRMFDFMGGGASYKDLWARRSRENLVCDIRRPTLGAAMFGARHWSREALSAVYRRIVPHRLRAARRDRIRRSRLAGGTGKFVSAVALWVGNHSFVIEAVAGCPLV